MKYEFITLNEVLLLFQVFLSVLSGAFTLGDAFPYYTAVGTALGAASMIFGVVERVPDIDTHGKQGLKPHKVEGRITFQDVSFSYPSRANKQVGNALIDTCLVFGTQRFCSEM